MYKRLIYLNSVVLVFGFILTSAANAADPTLVGWWKLDETSGTIAYDSSGTGNDGTLRGDPQWVEGKLGGAIETDGDGDCVEIPHSDSLDLGDAVTVALWAYDIGTSQNSLIAKGDQWHVSYNLVLANSGRVNKGAPHLRSVCFSGASAQHSGQGVASNTPMPLDEWVHVAGTFDISAPGNNQKIYINGVLDAERRFESPLETNTGILRIGAEGHGGGRYWWHGMLDDVHIYSRALTEGEIQQIMIGIPPGQASGPDPADGATDVPRNVAVAWTPGEFAATHDVYFGTVFSDVNDASRTDQRDVLASQGQLATIYDPPGLLDFGQTYYWRIDEVNAPPSSTIFKGDVWSFTVEPVGYPVSADRITITASSQVNPNQGPEKANDGSGLNEDGNHSQEISDMWLSGDSEPGQAWIQLDLDHVDKLSGMRVWNHNTALESVVGYGIEEALIEYSLDGITWSEFSVVELAQASGSADYQGVEISLGGIVAQSVRITANSNWSPFGLKQYGLSEVQLLAMPMVARELNPADGTTNLDPREALTWRAGREAAAHDVYLSTDEQAVIDGNAPVFTVPEASYSPLLELDATYFWKVNEVNEAEVPPVWEGPVQSFSTATYISVDDMEFYKSEDGKWIWETWTDGFDISSNGALLGHSGDNMETETVYEGAQSLPYNYGQGGAAVSEATLPIDAQDWSQYGIRSLSLYFHGKIENAPGQLYIKINNGGKILYPGAVSDLQIPQWLPWTVDLTGVTVVNSLTIGVDGGSGMFFIDAIRLYPLVAEVVSPSQVDTANLVLLYTFDGNLQDSSGKGNHGTPINDPAFFTDVQRGQVLMLDGFSRGVAVPEIGLSQTATICMWANPAVLDAYDSLFHADGWDPNDLHWRFRNSRLNGQLNGGPGLNGNTAIQTNQWYHVAFVVTESESSIWLNGLMEDRAAHPEDLEVPLMMALGGGTLGSWINASGDMSRHFEGMLDDVRIYDRALTQGELLGLVGRTLPISKGF